MQTVFDMFTHDDREDWERIFDAARKSCGTFEDACEFVLNGYIPCTEASEEAVSDALVALGTYHKEMQR